MAEADHLTRWRNESRTMLEGPSESIEQLVRVAAESGFDMQHDFIVVKANSQDTRRIMLARSTTSRAWLQARPETP